MKTGQRPGAPSGMGHARGVFCLFYTYWVKTSNVAY